MLDVKMLKLSAQLALVSIDEAGKVTVWVENRTGKSAHSIAGLHPVSWYASQLSVMS